MSAEIDLVRALEAGTLDPAGFGHRDHLRVAWALLGPLQIPFGDAYTRLRSALKTVAARAGRPGKYHETLTLAWLSLIHEELARTGEREDWRRFEAAAGERLSVAALQARYGAGGLDHPAARSGLVLPGALTGAAA